MVLVQVGLAPPKMNKEECVICKKECEERCIGGDRCRKEYLKEFEIDFDSIYKDPWKGYYFVCWSCLGKYKKEKQKRALDMFEELLEDYLDNGSATWWQSGKIECIKFFIEGTKDIIKSPNTFDGSFKAWLNGIFEVVGDVKDLSKGV